jgi:beta-glucosidase-like glycosyl hydrolase
VVDINSNPTNPVIGARSFGEDKENVALKGVAYMRGLQDHGVLASAKHFPGHGDTDADSHATLPQVEHNKNRLEETELYPFRKLFADSLQSVLVAHLAGAGLRKKQKPALHAFQKHRDRPAPEADGLRRPRVYRRPQHEGRDQVVQARRD